MSDALERISDIRNKLQQQRDRKRDIIAETATEIRRLRAQLDEAMVNAVDWAGETSTAAALTAGYSSLNAVSNARERIAKRRTKVR